MPKTKISEYSATANSNTDVASINIDEGCAPSGINNAIRAVMGHLKDFQQGTNGDPFNGPHNGTVGATTPSTGAFTTLSATGVVTSGSDFKVPTLGYLYAYTGAGAGTVKAGFQLDGAGAIYGKIADATITNISSTGLAVTGTLGASSNVNVNSSGTIGVYVGPSGAEASFVYNTDGNLYISPRSGFATSISGNVGIGTSSPGYKLDVLGNVNRFAGSNVDGIFLSTVAATDTSYYGANYYNNNGTEGVNASGRASWRIATLTAGSPTFSIGYRAPSAGAGVFSIPLTLDSSGNLLVGTTSTTPTNGGVVSLFGGGESYLNIGHKTGAASGAYYLAAYYNGSLVGGLTQSGTTGIVLTNLSDYRLKDKVVTMQGSLAKVLALNPVTYKWKSDGSDGEGFIAHELQTVIPTAATGTQDEVDEEGNAKYQGINLSALVPHLVKAIQEQQAIITQLTARITALEGA